MACPEFSLGLQPRYGRREPGARTVDIVPDIPFGFALPGGQPPDPNDPQQMQQFMASCSSCSRRPAAARSTGTWPARWPPAQLSQAGDPAVAPSRAQRRRRGAAPGRPVARAGSRRCPRGIQTTESPGAATSGSTNTLDVWHKLCDPVAGRMVGAMGDLVPRGDARPARPDARRWSPRSAARCSAASSARRSARSPPRCSRPATSACRSARPARPRWSRPTSREYGDGPGAARGPGAALRRPARGRPPAAVRARPVAARARPQRGGDLRGRHHGQPGGDRGGDGPHRPDQPRVDAGDGARGHLHAGGHARSRRPRWPAWRPRWRWSRAGSCHVVDRAAGDRLPDVGPAGRGVPAPPGRGRAGRADLRRAGRPGAAAAPAARGGRAVGRAHRAPGRPGPRRALGPPRPAARRATTSPTRRPSPAPSSTSPTWRTSSATTPRASHNFGEVELAGPGRHNFPEV